MVAFETLTARVTADVSGFTRDIGMAEESLENLSGQSLTTSGALQALKTQLNETEDDLSSVDREASDTSRSLLATSGAAGTTAGAFSALSVTTGGLSASFGLLSTTTTGSVTSFGALTAASGALLSTLAPLAAVVGTVTAGLGALAGAFGTVISSGILAFGAERGRQNRERLKEVNARIEALEDLEEKTGSLTEQQEEQLETLKERKDTLEEQTGIFGGLKSALSDLAAELKPIVLDFGAQFSDLIRDTIRLIPALVRNIFKAIGGLDRFEQVLRDLGNQAFRVIPQLVAGMFELARVALPVLMDGIRFISNNAAGAFQGMLRITRELAPELKALGAAFIDALPAIARLGTKILNVGIPALTKLLDVIENVITFAQDSDGFMSTIRQAITDFLKWFNNEGVQRLEEVASGIVGSIAGWLDNNQQMIQNKIVSPLITALGNATQAAIRTLNSEQFEKFAEEIGELAGRTLRTLADKMIEYAQGPQFKEDLQGLGFAVVDAVKAVILGGLRGLGPEAATRASPALFAGSVAADAVGRTIDSNATVRQRGNVVGPQSGGADVNINLNDGALEDLIDVRVDRRFDEERRRTQRATGVNRGP